ncbi:methyltransferase domain-containing protein [Paenibacillus sp. MSJ-34]|uniref:methyltransferase domain-containing protein n=1 Tax=Paenibacillus sp. MSJ-34 TaxID=2841529 RepID=UPI001C10EB67|nr:methyltransferase domain-containing protein [Paenibacillus sp. MSJ-34]MBU5440996.1 methyltransferase domain-containing protein [Paenibacillus sp. MSJ-34]
MIDFLDVYPHFANKKVIVWGTGEFYRKCTQIISFPIYCFIDNNQNKWGKELDGYTIENPSILNILEKDDIVLLLLNSFQNEILAQIDHYRLSNKKILTWDQIGSDIYNFQGRFVSEINEKNKQGLLTHKCNLCGESEFDLLYYRARNYSIVLNYVCMNCGFVFTYPRMGVEQHNKLYAMGDFSRISRKAEIPDEEKYKMAEKQSYQRYKILERLIPEDSYLRNGQKMIEIGSGTGSFLQIMETLGWEVTGIEPDINYAISSQDRYLVNVLSITWEEYTAPDESVDMICSFHVIEHVNDVDLFLRKAFKLLKKNGYIFIECPGIDRMHTLIDDFFWDVHINTFSEKVLRAFLEKAGFKVINSGYNELGFLWIIGTKSEYRKAVVYEKPQYIKNIVAAQSSPYKINADRVAVSSSSYHPVYKIGHVGIHRNTNAGDTLLFPYVRKVFQRVIDNIDFKLIDIHKPVSMEVIKEINNLDALIIGGGGVFLSDTNPNPLSGWQWACSSDLLELIEIPIIVFAVGYNRFRGQPDFEPIFKNNITTLLRKCIFFGVRNYGSLEEIKNYVPKTLWPKLTFQPCPTTLINKIDGVEQRIKPCSTKKIALNIALDRPFLRFGKKQKEILKEISTAVKMIKEDGWEVILFHHHELDEKSRIWFLGQGLDLTEVDLNQVTPEEIITYYESVDLCIGMRGHAQMIPFGLGVPILSIISHNKLQFFLDDINHPEWGIDVQSENISVQIYNFVKNCDLIKQKLQIQDAQERLYNKTLNNMEVIERVLKQFNLGEKVL